MPTMVSSSFLQKSAGTQEVLLCIVGLAALVNTSAAISAARDADRVPCFAVRSGIPTVTLHVHDAAGCCRTSG